MCITKKYLSGKEMCKVTFVLPLYLAENAKKANIVGEFNNWDTTSIRMKKVGGKFIRSVKLQANRDYQFRYLINGEVWKNDWDADALALVPFGDFYNSVVVV
jgi:1,4-alpha-glucan branching enzyme